MPDNRVSTYLSCKSTFKKPFASKDVNLLSNKNQPLYAKSIQLLMLLKNYIPVLPLILAPVSYENNIYFITYKSKRNYLHLPRAVVGRPWPGVADVFWFTFSWYPGIPWAEWLDRTTSSTTTSMPRVTTFHKAIRFKQ